MSTNRLLCTLYAFMEMLDEAVVFACKDKLEVATFYRYDTRK